MRKGQAELVEGIMAYEREYLEGREKCCKLHHVLRYYGISRHSLPVRGLALAILEMGEEEAKEWVREWRKTDLGCYTECELKAAIKLSRKLRELFKGDNNATD